MPQPVGPYRIAVAAELSGVPAATLRAWERRYGVPSPRRSSSAYRLYSAEEVALLKDMRRLVDSGMSPAEASGMVLGLRSNISEDVTTSDLHESTRARLLAAAQRYDLRAIDEEIARAGLLLDAQTFYEKIVSPVAVEVGQRWREGKMSIGQEHLLSERLELALRATLRAMDRTDGPLALLACIDGEQHVLGLLGAALRFGQYGARLVLLGAMTPPEAISEALRSTAPRVVGLSVTAPPKEPRALFRAYGKACGETPWVVGGPGASAIASFVTDAGGAVVRPGAWHVQVRDWLRGARA